MIVKHQTHTLIGVTDHYCPEDASVMEDEFDEVIWIQIETPRIDEDTTEAEIMHPMPSEQTTMGTNLHFDVRSHTGENAAIIFAVASFRHLSLRSGNPRAWEPPSMRYRRDTGRQEA